MKRMSAALALALLILTGCSGGEDEPEPQTAESSAPGSEWIGLTGEDLDEHFIEVIRSNTTTFEDGTDYSIVNLGHVTCDYIEETSVIDAVGFAVQMGFVDAHDAGFMVGTSVMAYCPQFRDQMP